ncbi:alpha/beta-hydrolase [Daldinia caldariorum]|uniref:alpha/beta-hydrolase n=1 Tax=Daldinia caldariorum TaxID=326644 RepID=UPI0020079B17|nr:alpha/beta-hydrolase [Daldinia caldariorum]KAI1467856.1 alpha/beta-hydrolase [Daldinia caldariorum]
MASINIPIIIKPSKPHTHTVIFLHGRGDNSRDFADSLSYSQNSRKRTLAPLRKCTSLPDTIFQWFNVWDMSNFSTNEKLQLDKLRKIIPAVHRILAREAALLGGRADRLVLAGISMGGATGAHVLFNLGIPPNASGKLDAFIGFSSQCPFKGQNLARIRSVLSLKNVPDNNNVIRNTPVLLEHCVDDPLVLIQRGRALRDTLVGFGAQIEWKEYPNGGHWFNSPTGIDDAVGFLNRHLGEDSFSGGPTLLRQASSNAMDLS